MNFGSLGQNRISANRHSAPSWLLTISDPRIRLTIQAIHADPARSWTVETSAQIAGVSRSTFALRFKQKVGFNPFMSCAGECTMTLRD
ncbi:helix-turn-helix transcriptional regulator [Pseudomonas gingeri]|uniref:Helix-turn-helix transcriptional regulator n=1 Tax=Pseudomonas gingeri TaxID=117681 RepID=A0A7Y8BNG4_9PSED|nr:AraC family transcriptional regulator [Pseudomonas gingeri]NWB50144.1 helix-turn-helix transcriptional regulator [Pseudomonas gingeri]